MNTISVTFDNEKILLERTGKVTFDEVFDALMSTKKLLPLGRPYPYLDSFIQLFGTKDGKFFKMTGREIQHFIDGNTDKVTMLSFEPTKSEYKYIELGLTDDIMSIFR